MRTFITIALFAASLLLAANPAAGQEATPIVSGTPGEGLPTFGFDVACGLVKVTVLTMTPYHGEHVEWCSTDPRETLFVSFDCGPDLPGKGEVKVMQAGNYTGSADFTVYLACELEGPTGETGLRCGDDNDHVMAILPRYGTWEATHECE